jgi:hypothetical protein
LHRGQMTAVAMVFPEPELRPSDPDFVIFSDGLPRVGAMVSGCPMGGSIGGR